MIRQLRTLVAFWFFAGMPLNMVLSGLYFLAGVPLPALLFFLSSIIYLSGGLLGVLWSVDSLRRTGLFRWDTAGIFLVLGVSGGFLLVGVIFGVIGFRRF